MLFRSLSEKVLRVFSRVFTSASRTFCIPFEWNPNANLAKLTPAAANVRILHLIALAVDSCIAIAFTAAYTHYGIRLQHRKKVEVNLIAFTFCTCLVNGIVCKLALFGGQEEVAGLVNKLLRQNLQLQLQRRRAKVSNKKSTDKVTGSSSLESACIAFFCIINTIPLFGFLVMMKPHSLANLYIFYAGSGDGYHLPGRFLFSVIVGVVTWRTGQTLTSVAFIALGCVEVLKAWLQELQLACLDQNTQSTRGQGSQGQGQDTLRFCSYRAVQVFNCMVQECLGPVLLPVLLAGFVPVLVACSSVLILFNSRMHLITWLACGEMGLVMVGTTLSGFELASEVTRRSEQLLRAMKQQTATAGIGQRELATYTPIRFRCGFAFEVGPHTGLGAVELVLDNASELVLMYREA